MRHQAKLCPNCLLWLDASEPVSGETELVIEDGDIAICAYCCTISVMASGEFRTATPQDFEHWTTIGCLEMVMTGYNIAKHGQAELQAKQQARREASPTHSEN